MRLSAPIAACMLLGLLASTVGAEPVNANDEQRWQACVQRFANVLSGSTERGELKTLVASHASMSPFDRNRTEAAMLLPDRLTTINVVSVHGCLHPSVSSASDLVADVKANGAIADSVRKQIVPPEGRDVRQADATMARWFTAALDAQPNDPVALIALYEDGQGSASARPTLHLVLIRGEFGADGTPRVSRVLYGPLESAAN